MATKQGPNILVCMGLGRSATKAWHSLLKRGSYRLLPNRDQISYSAWGWGGVRRKPGTQTETRILSMAATQGSDVLFRMPSRTKCILLVSVTRLPDVLGAGACRGESVNENLRTEGEPGASELGAPPAMRTPGLAVAIPPSTGGLAPS
jgi:hypothetical protein